MYDHESPTLTIQSANNSISNGCVIIRFIFIDPLNVFLLLLLSLGLECCTSKYFDRQRTNDLDLIVVIGGLTVSCRVVLYHI